MGRDGFQQVRSDSRKLDQVSSSFRWLKGVGMNLCELKQDCIHPGLWVLTSV